MANTTKNGTPRKIKAGSGRKTGGFSFVLIPLSDIIKKFADTTTPVKVSRVWAEQVGFTDLVSKAAEKLHGEIQGQTPETQVGATVKSFDD